MLEKTANDGSFHFQFMIKYFHAKEWQLEKSLWIWGFRALPKPPVVVMLKLYNL